MAAQVWVPSWVNFKMEFMMRPAVLTIFEGLKSLNRSVSLHKKQSDLNLIRDLQPGDVLIWVGVGALTTMEAHVLNHTVDGVMVVFYSTEAFFAHSCRAKQSLPVHEIWEYSMSNIHHCARVASLPYRYVPPGYVPRKHLPAATAYAKPNTLAFLGSNAGFYDKRRACLRAVAHHLMVADRGGSHDETPHVRNMSHCARDFCAPMNCTSSCALRVHQSTYADNSLDTLLRSGAAFLNVHKACNLSATSSVASCEAFRFSPLLSAGAAVFSEHCHPGDEEQYEDLVTFLPIKKLGAAVVDYWRDESPNAMQQRTNLFATRFAPAAIFERAGIPAALNANRIRSLRVQRTVGPYVVYKE